MTHTQGEWRQIDLVVVWWPLGTPKQPRVRRIKMPFRLFRRLSSFISCSPLGASSDNRTSCPVIPNMCLCLIVTLITGIHWDSRCGSPLDLSRG